MDSAGLVGRRWVHEDWDDTPEWRPDPDGEIRNRDFFGGDFQGVISKLDHLKDLGVETLYFNPIFEAAENHRYGTGDYEKIDPMLGTEADFRALCTDAHALGMRVVLAGVFNHQGFVSRYFNGDGSYESVGAVQSQDSPYYPWYHFSHWPDKYDSWWGIYSLPAVNEADSSYRRYIFGGADSIIRRWLAAGADGWRLDVADELPDDFIHGIHAAARQAKIDGDMEKARFGEFAKLYLNLTDRDVELPKTLEDIRDIYDKIALDEIEDKDRPDGELFRKGDVEVHGPHGTVIHSGVSGEARISALLAQMIDLARSDTIPFLQRAIASHFLFEYIHPFYDGNGRTGRYLLALYLSHDLTLPTVLSLSKTIAANKNEYYKAFTEAEDKLNRGELTFFVYTILGFIERAQKSLSEELGIKIDQLGKATDLRDELRNEHAISENATLLLYAVMQEELFDTTKSMTLEDAEADLRLTKQTVRKYVDELASAGLIEFVGRRPIKFRASEALRARMGVGAIPMKEDF